MSSLTDKEKDYIIRRARGEYAVEDILKKIKAARRANRNPGDVLYLDFLDVALSDRGDRKEYERLQREILDRHPNRDLWQFKKQENREVTEHQEVSRSRRRRAQADVASKFKFDDIPRLPSGWDPTSDDAEDLDQSSWTAGSD